MLAKIKPLVARSISVSCLVLVITAASAAQERYQPSTPTVSPYLNLFQNGRGGQFSRGVPNYYSLVRPQLQQQRVNKAQQTLIQQQGAAIQQVQENQQILQQQPVPESVTGHGSQFMNTSRYYSGAGTGQQAQRTQAQHTQSTYSPSTIARGSHR